MPMQGGLLAIALSPPAAPAEEPAAPITGTMVALTRLQASVQVYLRITGTMAQLRITGTVAQGTRTTGTMGKFT